MLGFDHGREGTTGAGRLAQPAAEATGLDTSSKLSVDAFPWAIWNQSQILDAHQSLEKAGCRAAETPPSPVDVDHPRPKCTSGRGVATLLPDPNARPKRSFANNQ